MWSSKSANKLTNERNLLREHYIHRAKLGGVSARVDNKPPRPQSHVFTRAKKQVKKKEENDRIQHDNKLLLARMLEIDVKPSRVGPVTQILNSVPSTGSLNRYVRIKELVGISQENERILKRLQTAKSCYSFKSWKKHAKKNEYLKYQLSTNTGRFHQAMDYQGSSDHLAMMGTTQFSRPGTARRWGGGSSRPGTAKRPSSAMLSPSNRPSSK